MRTNCLHFLNYTFQRFAVLFMVDYVCVTRYQEVQVCTFLLTILHMKGKTDLIAVNNKMVPCFWFDKKKVWLHTTDMDAASVSVWCKCHIQLIYFVCCTSCVNLLGSLRCPQWWQVLYPCHYLHTSHIMLGWSIPSYYVISDLL